MKKILVLMCLLLLTSQLFAYRLYGIKWSGSVYYYYINPVGVDDSLDYSGKNSQIQSSTGAWDGVSTSILQTQFVNTTSDTTWSGSDERNGQNTIIWKADGWEGSVIGVAAVWSSGGNIIEADIKLNTAFVNDYRLSRLIEHEVGHCLGIAHTREKNQAYNSEEYNAVMYWLLHTQDGFNCQDRCALTAIYPDGSCDAPFGTDAYACLPCCGGANAAPATASHSFSAEPAVMNESVTCEVVATDADGHDVKVALDWGDGTVTAYSALQTSGSTFSFDYTYTESGTFTVKARVMDEYGLEDSWTTLSTLEVTDELPVELSSFTGLTAADGVRLQWVTESEQINLGFILERKQNTSDWHKIADYQSDDRLRGQGTTARRTKYEYVDKNAHINATVFYRLSDVSINGERNVVAEIRANKSTPTTFAMHPAFPNPFNPITHIQYELPKAAQVMIHIYSITGKLVTTLLQKEQEAGVYQITWRADDVPSGIYLVNLYAGGYTKIQRVVLLK